VAGQTVYDSENHGSSDVTVQHAFELSSNVAMAKMAVQHYSGNPMQFINHLKNMGMDNVTGIDLSGEGRPLIYKPGHKLWGPSTIPWMAFGYNLLVSPLQTANLYNAVANNGKMMKPYLVSAIKEEGVLLREIQPKVVNEKICSDQTLAALKACLEGVCLHGTATTLFKGTPYKVAGKTGTALIANGKKGYDDKIYQSSFAGYFPADNPQYTCIVVIKNKPHAAVFYGAAVAGPVFKEIADRLYSASVKQAPIAKVAAKPDSNVYVYKGYKQDVARVAKKLRLPVVDSSLFVDEWATISHAPAAGLLKSSKVDTKSMPSLIGLGYKDLIYICESAGLKVNAQGRGKVAAQSIEAGSPIVKGQQIQITLN
jgi:cell division protein FtsI (penicillin-binding protein 3)